MKTLRNITLLLLAITLYIPVIATNDPAATAVTSTETAAISGRILDNNSGETLAGVLVAIEGTDVSAYSDLDGNFKIQGIEPGSYTLILSLISYKNSLIENIQLQSSEKEVVEIKLENN